MANGLKTISLLVKTKVIPVNLGQMTITDFPKWDNLPLSINDFLIGFSPRENMLTLSN